MTFHFIHMLGKNMLTKVKTSLPRREHGYGGSVDTKGNRMTAEGKRRRQKGGGDGRKEVLTAEGKL